MAKINIRSPYKITNTQTDLLFTELDIYIYTGTQVATLPESTYTLISSAIDDTSEFEISELIRDYIENNFDGTFPTDNSVWVNYRLTSVFATTATVGSVQQLRAFYGYDYRNETANEETSVLQSNSTIYTLADNGFHLAIDTENTSSVTYIDNQGNELTSSISTSTESDEQIQYISNVTAGQDSYEQRVLADGGTFENSNCLNTFLNNNEVFGVRNIYVYSSLGDEILDVVEVEECKYQPYKLTFINKFGAYQDIWFFKNSKKSLSIEKDDYKGTPTTINEHQYKILNKFGKEKITVNSGYYPESFNEIFKQLLFSEEVWIEYENQTLPVNISNSSFNYKTQLTDKLINYTLDLDFAFDAINSVR